MKVLCLKYFQHISKIIQIMQPKLAGKLKSIKSQIKIENRTPFSTEQQLQKELQYLKASVENLLKYCQNLEYENKMLKRQISSSNQIFQRNSYCIGQNFYSFQKNDFLAKQYSAQFNSDILQSLEKQNDELKKTRQLYVGSLDKIHCLKNQVAGLTQKLNTISKIYEKHELDQTDDSQKRDMFLTEQSLLPYCSKQSHDKNQEIDLEYLLCHQELSIDDPYAKQNNASKINNDDNVVGSLIAKGISFRQAKTIKSKEFEYLNTIIQKYRQQSQYRPKPLALKKYSSCIYR